MAEDGQGQAAGPEDVDFEAEGLLEGVEEGEAREARLQLLRELHDGGLSLEELRAAVEEDRLVLLPAELELTGEQNYTLEELAERTGLDSDFVNSLALALGLPRPGPEDRMLDEGTIEAAETIKAFLDAGVSQDAVLEVTRVAGEGMSNVAQAVSRHAAELLIEPGDTELDLGRRFAQAVADFVPRAEPLHQFLLRAHLREQVREGIVTRTELESGQLGGSREVAIAFADLEGFTRLGERIPPDEIGRVANRLAELATSVAEPPVRLVKTIGDAAMLACYDVPALLSASHTLVKTAEDEEDDDFPRLSAGLTHGHAVARNGDWYGAPVNLASRITSVARSGTVVVTAEVRERAGEGFDFSPLAPRKLKGVKGPVRLWRARPADQS
jgi:adenylate cyclase